MPPSKKLPALATSVGRFLQKLPVRWAEIKTSKKKQTLLISGILAGGLLLAGWHQFTAPNAWAVMVNGQQVAVVASRGEIDRTLQEIIRGGGAGSDQGVRISDKVDYREVRVDPRGIISGAELKNLLTERLHLVAAATVITIDGQPRLLVKDDTTADAVLAAFKQAYLPPAGTGQVQEVAFLEQVAYDHRPAGPAEILSPEAALAALRGTATASSTYTVKEGDSLWSIAREHNLLVADIQKANPTIQGERLDIGQQLKLAVEKPLLQVRVVYNQEIKEPLPFATQVEETAGLLRGQEKVAQEGSAGEQLVTYQVVMQNGTVVDKKVLQQQVLKEPVTRVVERGTRLALASRSGGSGRLAWPIRGAITSPFGYRGREFHSGLDISGSVGEAVGAAEAGVVISTGYDGGYGKMVVIDHGGGLVTRYAHLSGYNVRPGQRVTRGQTIGFVGMTGRTTGPHLHFEVLTGGSFQNPYNYLR